MDARVVENFLGARNAEEARALLVCFRADTGNLQDLGALFEFAVFLTVFDDVFRGGRVDARDMLKQRVRSGIDVNTDCVYAVLNDTCERLVQTVGFISC